MNKLTILLTIISMGLSLFKAPAPISSLTLEQRAEAAGMTVEDFVFISSVVEAESDRSESLEGRVLIALTIINRVEDSRFPDTINGVLNQSGQFSTVRRGRSIVERTDYSDEAVIQAVEWNEEGTEPNILFFNCRGYNIGEPYGRVDGNYFMTMEAENE